MTKKEKEVREELTRVPHEQLVVAYENMLWQNEVMLSQLHELGYEFGEKKRETNFERDIEYIVDLLILRWGSFEEFNKAIYFGKFNNRKEYEQWLLSESEVEE